MTYANFTRPLWNWLREPGSPAPGGINVTLGRTESFTGAEFYALHRAFTAQFAWRVRLHTMNALDTHDTPRFRTHAVPGSVPVAFGLAVTLPGIPVVFAGDEFGLTGDDGEHSRTPIPWDAVDDAEETISLYAGLIALRRSNPALSRGGIRWLAVEDDALVFVRETAAECVLVFATRGAATVELSAAAGVDAAGAELLLGDATLTAGGAAGEAGGAEASAGAVLSADGISFTAWKLPGVRLPRFHPPADDAGSLAGSGDVTPEVAPQAFEQSLEEAVAEIEELRGGA